MKEDLILSKGIFSIISTTKFSTLEEDVRIGELKIKLKLDNTIFCLRFLLEIIQKKMSYQIYVYRLSVRISRFISIIIK